MKKSTVTKYENGTNCALEQDDNSFSLWVPKQLQISDLKDIHKFLGEVLADLGVQLPNSPAVLTSEQKQLKEIAPMKPAFAIDG